VITGIVHPSLLQPPNHPSPHPLTGIVELVEGHGDHVTYRIWQSRFVGPTIHWAGGSVGLMPTVSALLFYSI